MAAEGELPARCEIGTAVPCRPARARTRSAAPLGACFCPATMGLRAANRTPGAS